VTVLIVIQVLDALLHGALVARFGVRQNEPFLVFAIVYLALAVITILALPFALWATLVLAVVGLFGLTVTFTRPARDKTLDKAVWAVDALVIVYAAYLLFVAG
jgi:hypothetical protein